MITKPIRFKYGGQLTRQKTPFQVCKVCKFSDCLLLVTDNARTPAPATASLMTDRLPVGSDLAPFLDSTRCTFERAFPNVALRRSVPRDARHPASADPAPILAFNPGLARDHQFRHAPSKRPHPPLLCKKINTYMPNVFDNIDLAFLPALKQTLGLSDRADFCIGYFNLRGWKQLDACIENWSGAPDRCACLLVGMQRPPQEELRLAMSLVDHDGQLDNQTVLQLKKKLATEFRDQLTIGAPNNDDEAGLRRLARQIRKKQVVVKLFLRHSLHAKLYLLFRPDPINPIVSYLGSSNLTFAGWLENPATTNLACWPTTEPSCIWTMK